MTWATQMDFIALAAFVGLICLAVWAGHWILRPMSREAQRLNLPKRYTLSFDLIQMLS